MVTAKVKKLIRERDQWCWHCGSDTDLVIHHRRNRGSGGSKAPGINEPQNLMLVCWEWNLAMESHFQSAELSRMWGHKVASWEPFDKPVFDRYAFEWYVLDSQGKKGRVEIDEGRATRLLLSDLFDGEVGTF